MSGRELSEYHGPVRLVQRTGKSFHHPVDQSLISKHWAEGMGSGNICHSYSKSTTCKHHPIPQYTILEKVFTEFHHVILGPAIIMNQY